MIMRGKRRDGSGNYNINLRDDSDNHIAYIKNNAENYVISYEIKAKIVLGKAVIIASLKYSERVVF
jgi:hypothetical protein